MTDVFSAPEYREAVDRETTVRDAAYLGISESIAGFEAAPLTLKRLMILRLMKSPLVVGGTPSPIELAAFLWLVHPEYAPANRGLRSRVMKKCRCFIPPQPPIFKTRRAMARYNRIGEASMFEAAKVITASRAYIAESFMDKGASKGTAKNEIDYYSDATFLCALFGREFGWTIEYVLNLPMKVIFQQINEMKQKHNPKLPLFNPSDRVLGTLVAKINSEVACN